MKKTCPHCGAYRPGLWGLGPALSRAFGRKIDILTLIPTTCIALFVLSLLLDLGEALNVSGGLFGMLSPSGPALYALGMTGGYASLQGQWWTIFTAIYLHGGLLHILFNVLWIRQLGPEVGDLYGPVRYFIIFTVGGVLGFVLSNALSGAPTVGASGSIFGLLAALIVYGRQRGGSAGTMMTRQIWQWAILLFVFGFFMSGVNNFAHGGGFIGGWISSRLLVSGAGRGESRALILLTLALLAVTALGFGLSFYSYWQYLLR
ncbi:MAG: rhomboid family intramembrane serine protease [bacterium]|nr:rhomboid family intramembrane serine protease [bacterium]